MKIVFSLVIGIAIGFLMKGSFLEVSLFDKSIFEGVSEISESEQKRLMEIIAHDSLSLFINKYGHNEAEIRAFTTTKTEYFKNIKTKDRLINKLKKELNNIGEPESVIIHEVKTIYRDTGRIKVKYVKGRDKELDYPLIVNKKDEWVDLRVTLNKENVDLDLEIDNSFTYSLETKNNIFKGTEYRVNAISNNPYTKTEGLRSLTIREPIKRLHFGLYGGFGYSIDNRELSPSVGIGFTYSLFSL